MCEVYAHQTGRYIKFNEEESDLETVDRRDFIEKRKNSDETKEKLYA